MVVCWPDMRNAVSQGPFLQEWKSLEAVETAAVLKGVSGDNVDDKAQRLRGANIYQVPAPAMRPPPAISHRSLFVSIRLRAAATSRATRSCTPRRVAATVRTSFACWCLPRARAADALLVHRWPVSPRSSCPPWKRFWRDHDMRAPRAFASSAASCSEYFCRSSSCSLFYPLRLCFPPSFYSQGVHSAAAAAARGCAAKCATSRPRR